MSSKNTNTRERILRSCWELLESGEGSAVRMSDIARKAGISRQAVYLHFPKRAELLIATTHYIDEIKDVDGRLARSRQVGSGLERLDAFIEAWGEYVPEIHGVAKALMAMMVSDADAADAWHGRMEAFRQGCQAAVDALFDDGKLTPDLCPLQATDLLWTMLSVGNWELLTRECGWRQEDYTRHIKTAARKVLIKRNPGRNTARM